ncbi:CsgG/HfaB family protein [Desulforhopalus singaporensis]|uniref:CsgG/HfaB family protein n=1 Tax=Desulforhopalus singaporensis TaxID=91360 RepID=UPI0015A47A5C|nr:CsgG/HfaB family protein [Desulforhopalus singaporensis]
MTTAFDTALRCLRGKISSKYTFAVGAIVDNTGKEQLSEGGTAKYVTQGAGDIVQTALLLAGVGVVNRRDPRVLIQEMQWGTIKKDQIIPSSYFITGSINSLDFIPGGGVEMEVAGGGPRYRQNRILIGVDLFLTDTKTGKVVASVPLQKQIVAYEAGVGMTRFFGEVLFNLDVGGMKREAMGFALRQMLYLGTFEILSQMLHPETYGECRAEIDHDYGNLVHTKSTEKYDAYMKVKPKSPMSEDRDKEEKEPTASIAPKAGSAAKSEESSQGDEHKDSQQDALVEPISGKETDQELITDKAGADEEEVVEATEGSGDSALTITQETADKSADNSSSGKEDLNATDDKQSKTFWQEEGVESKPLPQEVLW